MRRGIKRPRLTNLLTKKRSKSPSLKKNSPKDSETKGGGDWTLNGCAEKVVQKLKSKLSTLEIGIVVQFLLKMSILLKCCPGKFNHETGVIQDGDRQSYSAWTFFHLLFFVRAMFWIQYALKKSFWDEMSKGRPLFDHVYILMFIPVFILSAIYTVNVVLKGGRGLEYFNEFLKLDRIFAEKFVKKTKVERSSWLLTSVSIQEFPTVRYLVLLLQFYSIVWLIGILSYVVWYELYFPQSMCVLRGNFCTRENDCHPVMIFFFILADLWAGLFFSIHVFYSTISLGYSSLGIFSMMKLLRDQPDNDMNSLLSFYKKLELLANVALDFVNPLFMPCVPFLFETCIVFCNYGSIKGKQLLASGGIMSLVLTTSLSAIFTLIIFLMFRGGEMAFSTSSEFLSVLKRNCRFQLCKISPNSPNTPKEEDKCIQRKREMKETLLKTLVGSRPLRLELGNFSRVQSEASLPFIHGILDNTISVLLLF